MRPLSQYTHKKIDSSKSSILYLSSIVDLADEFAGELVPAQNRGLYRVGVGTDKILSLNMRIQSRKHSIQKCLYCNMYMKKWLEGIVLEEHWRLLKWLRLGKINVNCCLIFTSEKKGLPSRRLLKGEISLDINDAFFLTHF